ncbi:MAG: hypothetical protein HYZ49_19205 [Chloroflexi bacterium]|nr:hypothetical protein [Chloroflexota bacterium]
MKDFAVVQKRFMRDPLPIRLGGLAADLARVSSTAMNPVNSQVVQVLLEEARRFIEWTATETKSDTASQLVDLQINLTLWLHVWPVASTNSFQRALLAHQASEWSDRVLAMSGLTEETAVSA